MNPSAGKTDLPDFESGPFNHLGTSPYLIVSAKRISQVYKRILERILGENSPKIHFNKALKIA